MHRRFGDLDASRAPVNAVVKNATAVALHVNPDKTPELKRETFCLG